MRLDPNKAFPFPVLRNVADPMESDYPGFQFQADAYTAVSADGRQVELSVDFKLCQSDIKRLVHDGKAKYGCTVVSPMTLYREILMSAQPSIRHTFGLGDLADVVELRPCVVAVNEISGYSSGDFHEEFGNSVFDIPVGSPLAQDVTLAFPVDQEFLKPITSIFDIVPDEKQPKGRYDTRFIDRVQIIMHPDNASQLISARKNSNHRASIMTSFYLPVVMNALSEMIRLGDDALHDSAELWCRVFRFRLEQEEISFENLSEGKVSLLEAAQRLLEDPIRHLEYM